MAYTPTTWQSGDVISAEKMNKIEQGIANSGSGTLVVTATTSENTTTLDKTWQEIYDAFPNVYMTNDGMFKILINRINVFALSGEYMVIIGEDNYFTTSPTGYPSFTSGGK